MSGEKDLESHAGDAQSLSVQIQELQKELSEMEARSRAVWELLTLIGSRLQLSSTSIKMAVSSLLEYDIFWDPSTSHEFLQVIDTSTDRTSDLVVLLTLAFRSQAKSLEIGTEPQMIQEILDALQNRITKRDSDIKISVDYPADGKLALVDYQYLVVALSLLIEVVVSEMSGLEKLSLQAFETPNSWQLNIGEIDPEVMGILQHFFRHPNDFGAYTSKLVPENVLKLMVACRILHLQEIELVEGPTDITNELNLSIPFADSNG